jgi:hypothetical protein
MMRVSWRKKMRTKVLKTMKNMKKKTRRLKMSHSSKSHLMDRSQTKMKRLKLP